MKKILCWLLALALGLGCCGCGSQAPATETTPSESQPAPLQDPVKVTLQPNNGDAATVLQVEQGTLVQDLPIPTKRACAFVGWTQGDDLWDAARPIEKAVTLIARWTLSSNAFRKDPNAGVRAEGTALRVCSFNTLLPTVGSKVPVAGRDASLFNMVTAYKPDVIAFQEFNAEWADGFRTVFAGTDYRLISGDSSKVNGKTVNCTLVYNASVLTLVEYDSFPYAASDSKVSRVLTWALFETTGEAKNRFIATTTHWALTEEQRVEEAIELADWIKSTQAHHNVPIIAMGDYNSRDGASSYSKLMRQASLKDAKYAAEKRGLVGLTHHGRSASSYTDDKINIVASIDHIFYTDGLKPLYYDTVLDEESLLTSDHCPIYVDFRFLS